MRSTPVYLFLTILAVLVAAAAAAAQTNYVDLTPRLEKWFHADNALALEGAKCDNLRMRTHIGGTFNGAVIQTREIWQDEQIVESTRMLFSSTPEGHILYHGDPVGGSFAEPVVWVESPLEVGKSWTGSSPAAGGGTVHYVFAVLEERAITCPVGTYDCHRVFVATINPDGTTDDCDFWYSPNCGLIRCALDGQGAFALQKSQILVGPDVPDLERDEAAILELRTAPNPLNPSTTVRFTLQQDSVVSVVVFDLAGRRVRTLARAEHRTVGSCAYPWDGRDEGGRGVASGTYFVRVSAGDMVANGRMVLVR